MTQDKVQSASDGAPGPRTSGAPWRSQLPFAFAAAGATLGLALGFLEAGLLGYIPRFAGMTQPDVRGAIWMIAPLADAPVGALAGLLLGGIAALPFRSRLWPRTWAAAAIGLAAGYLGWLLSWFRVGVGIVVPMSLSALPPMLDLALPPILYFAVGCAGSALLLGWLQRRKPTLVSGARHSPYRLLAGLDLAVLAVLSLALIATRWWGPQTFSSPSVASPERGPHNNVVLIMLDTVRADHLSCYGYARPTTPNLDRLARQGVLFEHAVAPTSWTLPSLASVFTGLLPHQHAADWHDAMASQPLTLAEILKARGYQTASFNANQDFGLAGWGLAQGFDVYADAHDWLRHNLAATFAGQSIYQSLFREFVSFNEFDRLNAGQINQQVFDWLGHRSGRPYFLFINYVDAHRPYLPPAPYDRRFGRIPKAVLWHTGFALHEGHWSQPVSVRERQDLVDGYDNSLNYLDEQVGRLLDTLRTSRDAGRTFVIVAGDHGESFGEHGTYDHGWNLYREVLQVPLLVAGPGLPAGQRVESVAELRELFPTVIQLALARAGAPVEQASLSRFWTPGSASETSAPVVSELTRWTRDWRQEAMLSLVDARWQYILDSNGHAELFDWQNDAAEQQDVGSQAALQTVVERLGSQMESILGRSVFPWRNVNYLSPLDRPGMPFVRYGAMNHATFQLIGQPVGSSQAFFLDQPPAPPTRPISSREELLRSLPYVNAH